MGNNNVYRSGFIAIIGRPNVGKSTLLNQILKEKVAIVSDKPQTTRTKILGVKNFHDAQMVFLDTPGIHKPKYKLNERMVKTALDTLAEADIIFFMVEAGESPGAGDRFIMERLKSIKKPIFLLINKVDIVKKDSLLPLIAEYGEMFNFTEIFPISALNGDNVDRLVEVSLKYLPEGPQYFPDGVVTDQPVKFIISEIIREKILERTREEIPYSVAVVVEETKEDADKGIISIRALIYVERDSQKAIVIGRGGSMLKEVGTVARTEIEKLLGSKVFLELWVKVKKDWRKDERIMPEILYTDN